MTTRTDYLNLPGQLAPGLGGDFTHDKLRGQPMQTYATATPFYPADPHPQDFHIEDIAHNLSLICRFGGHTRVFYSVAQHSCLVHDLLDEHRAEGLLHDRAEAYIGDMITPVKVLFPAYKTMEHGIERVSAMVFGLTWPQPPEIKQADLRVLATEKRDLMKPADWGPLPAPLETPIEPWSPERAYEEFTARAQALGLWKGESHE